MDRGSVQIHMQSFINRRVHETGMGRQQNGYSIGKARVIKDRRD